MPVSTTVPQTAEQRRETLNPTDERLRAAVIHIGAFEPNLSRVEMCQRLADAGVFKRNGRYMREDGDELKLLFPDMTDK